MEPSEVRSQTSGYEQAFIEHESKGRYSDGTISEWKAALSEVQALKGWKIQSMPNRKNRLNALMGKRDWLGEGSKDLSSLVETKRRDHPLDDYLAHSKKAVGIAGCLPLALEVIGSLLLAKNKEKWDAKLKKLEKVPYEEVSSELKISYKALNALQKHVFLDIACFFIGCDKKITIYMWDDTLFFPEEALEVLQYMSLIKIKEDNTLSMHNLLRGLGARNHPPRW
ncbi:disease resistance protein L6-like [Rhodamnia argentea]|uniref:Disease resistance protein L6-like n=1 Tax=Rhodamnia argentea TaxID=178133 RepID=A0ABM3HVU0_9MYRT|nr:disease resistance protein L6-like [Rhodamnia argentea]